MAHSYKAKPKPTLKPSTLHLTLAPTRRALPRGVRADGLPPRAATLGGTRRRQLGSRLAGGRRRELTRARLGRSRARARRGVAINTSRRARVGRARGGGRWLRFSRLAALYPRGDRRLAWSTVLRDSARDQVGSCASSGHAFGYGLALRGAVIPGRPGRTERPATAQPRPRVARATRGCAADPIALHHPGRLRVYPPARTAPLAPRLPGPPGEPVGLPRPGAAARRRRLRAAHACRGAAARPRAAHTAWRPAAARLPCRGGGGATARGRPHAPPRRRLVRPPTRRCRRRRRRRVAAAYWPLRHRRCRHSSTPPDACDALRLPLIPPTAPHILGARLHGALFLLLAPPRRGRHRERLRHRGPSTGRGTRLGGAAARAKVPTGSQQPMRAAHPPLQTHNRLPRASLAARCLAA